MHYTTRMASEKQRMEAHVANMQDNINTRGEVLRNGPPLRDAPHACPECEPGVRVGLSPVLQRRPFLTRRCIR